MYELVCSARIERPSPCQNIACLFTHHQRTCFSGPPGRGKEAGRQETPPSFRSFGEPEGAHCSLLHLPNGEITTQGREESCAGAEKQAQRDSPMCAESRTGSRAPGFWRSCRAAAQNPAWLLWASARLSGHRAACLAGLRGEGWRMGALTKSSFAQASGQTAIPPASCLHSHVYFPGHNPHLRRFPGGGAG